MTLATVSGTSRPRRLRLRRTGQVALSFDALVMAASLGVCVVLFAEGGLEAGVFCMAGAAIAARNAAPGARLSSSFSGGFAGLFAGAMFAAFFHGALVALVSAI